MKSNPLIPLKQSVDRKSLKTNLMARFISQTLIRTNPNPFQSIKSGTQQHNRYSTRSSNKSAQLIEIEVGEAEEVLVLKKLDDVIHNIMVRQSAPDWLPFVPGSSYWVPPRSNDSNSNNGGIVEVLKKRLTQPLTDDGGESVMAGFSSSRTSRGWPSSSYFIRGTSPVHPVEVKGDENEGNMSQPEDVEG